MSTAAICRIAGGVLVLLVGTALGAGGIQLWRGGPQAWPDIIADKSTVRRTSGGMIVMAALLLVAGAAATGNLPWGGWAAAIATIVVVLAAFWVNYALFGDIRPLHTGTNFVVAAIILTLLWFGYATKD
jgi:hypothetical protein